MFGSSLGRKVMAENARPVLVGFRDAALRGGTTAPSRDAVLMFNAWLHYAVSYLLSARQLKPSDIAPVIINAGMAVRAVAADHGLGQDYLEEGMHRVREALSAPDALPAKWVSSYFDAVSHLSTMDSGIFVGAVLRETVAVHQVPDRRR